jgi:hypothetical protein
VASRHHTSSERCLDAKGLTSRKPRLPLVDQPAPSADSDRSYIVRPHVSSKLVGVQKRI